MQREEKQECAGELTGWTLERNLTSRDVAEMRKVNYRLATVYRDSTVATSANPDKDTLIKQLRAGRERYKKEGQRCSEILLGHYDVTVADIMPQ